VNQALKSSRKTAEDFMVSKFPKVSIIVPTFNEERNIASCIKSIRKQDYPKGKIEIVVVDQQSDDRTQKIARQHRCKVVIRKRPKFYTPPSISRNVGYRHSSGDFLFHLDADMMLTDKKLFKKAIQMFKKDKKIGALVIHEKDLVKNYWAKCIALERKCYIGTDMEASRFVRRDIFEKVGGYDENISSGEDWDIDRMYRGVSKVIFSGLYLSHNIGNVNFWEQLEKKSRYSRTGQMFFRKHHISGFLVAGKQLYYILRNYKLLLREPLVALGMFFLRFCEYGYGFYALIRHRKTIGLTSR
jgi:glycosyltransferase involved in cell wall biosynthesis